MYLLYRCGRLQSEFARLLAAGLRSAGFLGEMIPKKRQHQARRAYDALPPGGEVLVHDFMVDDAYDGPPFAAWYLLASMLDNPGAECLTPRYVEGVLRRTGFVVDPTEVMLPGITMITRATKPN